MRTKLFIFSLLSALFLMVACEPQEPKQTLPNEALINTIILSLDSTPEQFAGAIAIQGFKEAALYNFSAYSYWSFTNVNLNSDSDYTYTQRQLITIIYKGDAINSITYDCYLNEEKSPADYYRLFSKKIADIGYSDWHGYYDDPTNEETMINNIFHNKDYSSSKTVSNRKELYSNISNDSLHNPNTVQYFLETFNYTHSKNSQWAGRILMYSSKYFSSGEDEDHPGKNVKDITLSFSLDRIQ